MKMQLGHIAFEPIAGPSSFSLEKGFRYNEQVTLEGKPKLQYAGESLDVIPLVFTLHQDFCDVKDSVDTLKSAASDAQALPLVFANGEYFGKFVIEKINISILQTTADGSYIAATVDTQLKEATAESIVTEKKSEEGSKKKSDGTDQSSAAKDKDDKKGMVRQE